MSFFLTNSFSFFVAGGNTSQQVADQEVVVKKCFKIILTFAVRRWHPNGGYIVTGSSDRKMNE